MVAQNTLLDLLRLPWKTSECVIRHRQDGDGFPAINFTGEIIFGQKIVKVAEFGVSSEEPGDVEGSGGRDKEEAVEDY